MIRVLDFLDFSSLLWPLNNKNSWEETYFGLSKTVLGREKISLTILLLLSSCCISEGESVGVVHFFYMVWFFNKNLHDNIQGYYLYDIHSYSYQHYAFMKRQANLTFLFFLLI